MQRLAVVFGGGTRVRRGRLRLSSKRTWCSLCLWEGDKEGRSGRGEPSVRRGPAGSHTQVPF